MKKLLNNRNNEKANIGRGERLIIKKKYRDIKYFFK